MKKLLEEKQDDKLGVVMLNHAHQTALKAVFAEAKTRNCVTDFVVADE